MKVIAAIALVGLGLVVILVGVQVVQIGEGFWCDPDINGCSSTGGYVSVYVLGGIPLVIAALLLVSAAVEARQESQLEELVRRGRHRPRRVGWSRTAQDGAEAASRPPDESQAATQGSPDTESGSAPLPGRPARGNSKVTLRGSQAVRRRWVC